MNNWHQINVTINSETSGEKVKELLTGAFDAKDYCIVHPMTYEPFCKIRFRNIEDLQIFQLMIERK